MWFRVTSNQCCSKKLALHVCVRKGGETLAIFINQGMNSGNIHALWVNLWAVFM